MKLINLYKTKLLSLIGACMMVYMLSSCGDDLRDIEPATSAVYGGGTLTEYMAYDIDSMPGQSVFGKVVFWKSSQGYTLVQISLNNTVDAASYPSAIYTGAVGAGAVAKELYSIDGTKGEFGQHKFYAIDDADFYDNLTDYDGHVAIMNAAGAMIAAGNIGSNAIGG